jgi:hypothetical protein
MKTIAKQLKVKDFPFIITDANNNIIYYETSNGYWCKKEFDANNNEIYFEKGSGFWCKREYDENTNLIYYEDADGDIVDNRPKIIPECTMEELVSKLGFDFKIKK